MSWRYYKSSDAGAPVLNGTVGSVITVLDAVLVNGYGSKPSAGWTKPFSGTNKAVYYSAAGSSTRFFYRVLDDGSGAVGARDAAIRGYETMSDVDTGTGPFPTVAMQAAGLSLGKSTALNSTAVQWFILASGQTFLMGVLVGRWQVAYVGEFDSFTPSDSHNACIIAAAAGSTPDGFSASAICIVFQTHSALEVDWSPQGTVAIARLSTQAAGSVYGSLMHTSAIFCSVSALTNPNDGWGKLPKLNPADGAAYFEDLILNEYGSSFGTRGKLRGIHPMPHRGTQWNDEELFDGTGDLSGRQFLVLRMTPYQQISGSPVQQNTLMAFEISNTI